MFSERTRWDLTANRLSEAVSRARRLRRSLIDLTESNPTAAGLHYSKWEETATLFYEWNAHVSPYISYNFERRRSDESPLRPTYQDYDRHVVMIGVSVAY